MPGFLNTPRKKSLFVTPNSFTPRQRANGRYRIKKDYKGFIADLKTILESANEKDKKFFLDMLLEIPKVSENLSAKKEHEETGHVFAFTSGFYISSDVNSSWV